MGLWRTQMLPRLVDITLRSKEISAWRVRCVDGLAGVVVEPGFGSGLNVPHYPPAVNKVYAIDPAVLGQKLAADRVAASDVEIEYVGLDGETLPLDDDCCDSALLTFTLCTIPDAPAALAELRRVLRPEGSLHFLEHGLAPDPGVQRWQHRLTPIQKRVADGCHLNRTIVDLITTAGFTIDWSDASYAKGPKPGSFFYIGRALNP